MKVKAKLCVLAIFSLSTLAHAQQWSKYIPEKQRKDIYKKSSRATGAGAVLTGRIGAVAWVTESMARAIVSNMIDRERLTPDEAEARYRNLRLESNYLFIISSVQVSMSPIGTSGKSIDDPLIAAETFLQRADDKQKFSKVETTDHQSDVTLGGAFGGTGISNIYKVVFAKTDRSGSPLVRDLADKIEIQFNLSGKKIVFEYKLKDLVTRLEDL